MGRTLHNLGGHWRRHIQADEPEDRRRRGKSMERGKLMLVLPIVYPEALSAISVAAQIGNPCKTRSNKKVLPKILSPKALGGSSTNSPREKLSSLTRHYLKHSGA